MTTLLEQKKKRLAQQKARLQTSEALLKIQERKAQLSRYIRIGELAEKAGIASLDLPTLLGAFLSIAEAASDPKALGTWASEGENKLLPKR